MTLRKDNRPGKKARKSPVKRDTRNEGKRISSSASRLETTNEKIEREKRKMMESDSESADDDDKRSGAGSNIKNTAAYLKAKNEELEKKIESFDERERRYDALHEENEDIRENLQKEVVRLNKAIKDLNKEIRVVEEQTLNAHDNSGIEMDAVEYDRVCCYVRKTLFRKVKFTLDKALDSVKKGSIGYTISDVFNIHDDDRWSWWQCYKQAAHHGIAQARNGKITEIKNCYKRKKQYMLAYALMFLLNHFNTLFVRSLLCYSCQINVRRE